MKTQTRETKTTALKSATITLHGAQNTTLTLLATVRTNGDAVTTVTTREAGKKPVRGMTETHANMAAAKAHLDALAQQAIKLGWQRRARVGNTKPDAFSKLPVPPKVA